MSDPTLPVLSPADEALLAAAGLVADPARPGHWIDTRGRNRSLTTTVALRRARRDLTSTPNGRAPAAATAEALIEPLENDSMDSSYTDQQHTQDTADALDPYDAFVARKLTRSPATGLDAVPALHPLLMPHQRDLVGWALRRGRAAIFADTGLGKMLMELEWSRVGAAHAGGDVLILAPLAVAQQIEAEGSRFGIPVTRCRDGADVRSGINVTNYDRLHRFDAAQFVGVVLDESSCIKHYDSHTLRTLLDAFASRSVRSVWLS